MEEILIDLTGGHRPGALAEIFEDLAASGIDILNVAAAVSVQLEPGAPVAIITDNTQAAYDVLFYDWAADGRPSGRPLECMHVRPVHTATIPDRPGSLAELTRKICDEGENITSMYVLNTRPSSGVEIGYTVESGGDISVDYQNQ